MLCYCQATYQLLHSQIKGVLPEEHEELELLVEALPLCDRPPSHPFAGIVLDINIITKAHRDGMDDVICLVIPVGHWTGGELCLHEPGICLELSQGDIVIFRSREITHFNLRYDGYRASIVLHSDKHLKSWHHDRNGFHKFVYSDDTW